MSAKRSSGKKRIQPEDDEDSNHNQPAPKKRKISINETDLISYKCVICRELPESKIFQCSSGHIMCAGCYNSPNFKPHKCPICKIELKKNPIRSIVAEQTLKLRKISCSNRGCPVKLKYGELKQHIDHECDFKITECNYKCFGCDWKGFRKNKKEHESECKQQFDIDDILKMHEDTLDEYKYALDECNKYEETADDLAGILLNFTQFKSIKLRQKKEGMNWKKRIKFKNPDLSGEIFIKYDKHIFNDDDNKIVIKAKLVLKENLCGQIDGYMVYGIDEDDSEMILGRAPFTIQDIDGIWETGWIELGELTGSDLEWAENTCKLRVCLY